MNTVSLAIVYTPDQGSMPMILGRVADRSMLMAALQNAALEAENRARDAADEDAYAARGHQEQASVLRRLLSDLTGQRSISRAIM